MQSTVEIANLALMRIGVSRYIEDLRSATIEAQLVNRIFDMTRRRALRRLPWAFARDFVKLGLTTEESARWNYVYQYPADALRVFYVSTPELEKLDFMFEPIEFQTMTRNSIEYVCTDLELAYAQIVRDVSDVSLFDSLFVDYLAWELAKDLAAPLSVNGSLVQLATQGAQVAFETAREASLDERYVGKGKYMTDYVRARV